MAFMVLHCQNCGGHWEVYSRDSWTEDDDMRICPHCFSEIDEVLWDAEIVPTFGTALDANRELEKYSLGYRTPLFSVDFIADHMNRPKDDYDDIDLDDYDFSSLERDMEKFIDSLSDKDFDF